MSILHCPRCGGALASTLHAKSHADWHERQDSGVPSFREIKTAELDRELTAYLTAHAEMDRIDKEKGRA